MVLGREYSCFRQRVKSYDDDRNFDLLSDYVFFIFICPAFDVNLLTCLSVTTTIAFSKIGINSVIIMIDDGRYETKVNITGPCTETIRENQ